MLSALVTMTFFAAIFSVLIVAIVFSNKFAVLCLSLLTAYLATLVFLSHRRKQEASLATITPSYGALPQPQVTVWTQYDAPVIETPDNPYALRRY